MNLRPAGTRRTLTSGLLIVGGSLSILVLDRHVASPSSPALAAQVVAPNVRTQDQTPAQRREEHTVSSFFEAYDRHSVPAIFGLLGKGFRYADCDFARHYSTQLDTKKSLKRWLTAQFREHDRFVVSGSPVANPGPGMVAVTVSVVRHGDALDPRVAQGLISTRVPKIVVRPNGRLDFLALADQDDCLAGTLPQGANPDAEQALAQSFLDAYNAHDIAAVLATLTDGGQYFDCNTASLSGKTAVAAWLRARFAAGDRIVDPRMLFDSYWSEPSSATNSPVTVLVHAMRIDGPGQHGSPPKAVTLRLVPNADVTQIQLWQVWSGCS